MHADGAFAEFVRVPAGNVVKLSQDQVPLPVGAFLDALGNAVHATQVADLAGSAVLITGFGPLGAMAAAIAEHCGARTVVVTDVSDHALETARRWAAARNFANLHAFNAASDPVALKRAVLDITDGVGVDIVLEMSGGPSAFNFGLDVAGAGATVSLLGIPAGGTLLVEEYARNIVFKGLRIHGIVGRRMYDTWHRMLGLLEGGLDVSWVVEKEYSSLDHVHDAMDCLERREALKVLLYTGAR